MSILPIFGRTWKADTTLEGAQNSNDWVKDREERTKMKTEHDNFPEHFNFHIDCLPFLSSLLSLSSGLPVQ